MIVVTPQLEQRFMSKVEKISTCWLWNRPLDRDGYGSFFYMGDKKYTLLAPRAAYEIFIGEIPDGLVIDHLCGVRSCVNPDHLEAVTIAENNRRIVKKLKRHCETCNCEGRS